MTQTQSPQTQSSQTPSPAADRDAIRARYQAERDKRVRTDGNAQYEFITAGRFAAFGADPWTPEVVEREPRHDEVDLTVLGGGFGGLLAGGFARKAGIESVRVVDTAGDFGGTWYWNRYPGLACDIESYVYLPLIEEVGTIPSRKYAPGEEIRQHALALADHFDLRRDTLFQTKIETLTWNDVTERWVVTTDRGDEFTTRYVVISGGVLQRPKMPNLPGIEEFQGHAFHTSRWDFDYTGGDWSGGMDRLRDKRVAVVGTGATGLQVVPQLVDAVKELLVVQRTPSAVDVRGDEETDVDWFTSQEPGWSRRRRTNFVDIVNGQGAAENLIGDAWTDIAPVRGMKRLIESGFTEDPAVAFEEADFEKMEEIRQRVAELVEDPATAAALQPWYKHMCKRPGFSDRYLQSFNASHVQLVDTRGQGIERFTEKGFVANGVEHEVDLVIFATGYEQNLDAATNARVEVRGRDGVALSDYWSDGLQTLHGWIARGFPNLVHMGLLQNAHSVNYTHILEDQARHAMEAIAEAERRGGFLVEPTQEAQDAWVEVIKAQPTGQDEFLAECTPGYYNQEGQPIRSQVFQAGPSAFNEILDAWRAEHLDQVLSPSRRS